MTTGRPDHTGSTVISGPVTITGSITITGPVDVTGSTVSISGTVTVAGTVSISGTVTVTGTVSISGPVTVTGSVTVSGTVSISGSVTVTGTVAISGTVTVTGSVTVSGTVAISGTVTVSGTVAISGTVTVTGSVTVSGTVSISGSVAVTGTVAISGSVTVTGTVSISGSVTITGPVTISTLAADNVIVDLLRQGSVIEDRRTLSNDADLVTPSFDAATGASWRGKAFSRGCLGFIYQIGIYCRNTGSTLRTVTLKLFPYPFGPLLKTATFTVAGSGAAAWRYASINDPWLYHGMTVMFQADHSDIEFGYDNAPTDPDGYSTSDTFVTWSLLTRRYYVRPDLTNLTVGDVPISGIVNNIPIPNVSASVVPTGDVEVASGATNTFLDILGGGTLSWLVLRMYTALTFSTSPAYTKLHVYVDGTDIVGGKKVYDYQYLLPAHELLAWDRGAWMGQLPWGWYNINPTASDDGVFYWAFPVQFLRSLKITVENTSAGAITYVFGCAYNLLR